MNYPRVYKLIRNKDISGVSGTGLVAWATEYPNGMTTVCWAGAIESVVVYRTLADAIKIHGHEGATEFVEVPVYYYSVQQPGRTKEGL